MNHERSIRIDPEVCDGCMACMRSCPTQAIRVRAQKASILNDRCIDCGECIRECPLQAIAALTGTISDFSRFKMIVALPSPVLYAQFGKEYSPTAILDAFKHIGFDEVYDVACPDEAVSIAIQEHLIRYSQPRPFISPFCPAVVRFIQIKYPNLLDHLIPIESPMEIAAREAKRQLIASHQLKPNEIGCIYITPCPAKIISIQFPPRKNLSFIDGVIGISEVYPLLLQELARQNNIRENQVHGLGLGWPVLGGELASLRAEDCLAIGGITHVISALEEIENGKLSELQFLECHSCPMGCVSGSLTVENPYIARARILQLVETYGVKPCQNREYIQGLYQKKFFSLTGTIPPIPMPPLNGEIGKAIQKMHRKQEIMNSLPGINCGACGSPTCQTFAEDVVHQNAIMTDCVFIAIKSMQSSSVPFPVHLQQHAQRVKTNIDTVL